VKFLLKYTKHVLTRNFYRLISSSVKNTRSTVGTICKLAISPKFQPTFTTFHQPISLKFHPTCTQISRINFMTFHLRLAATCSHVFREIALRNCTNLHVEISNKFQHKLALHFTFNLHQLALVNCTELHSQIAVKLHTELALKFHLKILLKLHFDIAL